MRKREGGEEERGKVGQLLDSRQLEAALDGQRRLGLHCSSSAAACVCVREREWCVRVWRARARARACWCYGKLVHILVCYVWCVCVRALVRVEGKGGVGQAQGGACSGTHVYAYAARRTLNEQVVNGDFFFLHINMLSTGIYCVCVGHICRG